MRIKSLTITDPIHVDMLLEDDKNHQEEQQKTVITFLHYDGRSSFTEINQFGVKYNKHQLLASWKQLYFVQQIDAHYLDCEIYLVDKFIIALK